MHNYDVNTQQSFIIFFALASSYEDSRAFNLPFIVIITISILILIIITILLWIVIPVVVMMRIQKTETLNVPFLSMYYKKQNGDPQVSFVKTP